MADLEVRLLAQDESEALPETSMAFDQQGVFHLIDPFFAVDALLADSTKRPYGLLRSRYSPY